MNDLDRAIASVRNAMLATAFTPNQMKWALTGARMMLKALWKFNLLTCQLSESDIDQLK